MPSSKGPHFVRITPDLQLPHDLEGSGSLNSLTFSSPIPLSTWTPIPPLFAYPYLLIYYFCPHCVQAFFSCSKQGVFSICSVRASHCGGCFCCGALVLGRTGFRSCGSRALEQGLSSCGTQAWLLRGMWNLPGPGIKPVSLALTGGFLTTGPPGKSLGMYPLFSQRTGIK